VNSQETRESPGSAKPRSNGARWLPPFRAFLLQVQRAALQIGRQPGRRIASWTRVLPRNKQSRIEGAEECVLLITTKPARNGPSSAGRGFTSNELVAAPVDRWGPAPSRPPAALPETIESHGGSNKRALKSRAPASLGIFLNSGKPSRSCKKWKSKAQPADEINHQIGRPPTS